MNDKQKAANIIGPIVVGLVAAAIIGKLIGPKAGIIGALLAMGLHEVLDAKASNAVYKIIS